ncbi:putative DNA mismatch repair protein Msh6 [Zopfochytrium polystomum]|nr:putative DNA mismatch repair protein Msh6 [Zopfochytrium polystomum]
MSTGKGQRTITSFFKSPASARPLPVHSSSTSTPPHQQPRPLVEIAPNSPSWDSGSPSGLCKAISSPFGTPTPQTRSRACSNDNNRMLVDAADDDEIPLRLKTRSRSAIASIVESDNEDDVANGGSALRSKRKAVDDEYQPDGTDDEDGLRERKRTRPSLATTPISNKSLDRFGASSLRTPTSHASPQSEGTPTAWKSPSCLTASADKRKVLQEFAYDPDYDPRTLYIPTTAWSKFSPFETQFWQIKATHWDTVLYEKDADIAHQEFDWKLTDRVNMKMCGVPESSFETWASQFVAKGYKVAKVDQAESQVAKDIRERKQGTAGSSKKEEKILRRELTMVLTAGTLVDSALLTNDMATYCMAIKEGVVADHEAPSFGICFVDTATAEFRISAFKDDVDRTKLETIILQIKPKELVLEKGLVSPITARLLKNCLDNPIYNYLLPDEEFWDSATTLMELEASGSFAENGVTTWPPAMAAVFDNAIALSAIGGLVSYLRTLKLDSELLSARNFHEYDPLRQSGSLIIDGQTLLNLEVFENSTDGSAEGTLIKLLNHCMTPSGTVVCARVTFFPHIVENSWVCHPLYDLEAINQRLDAVDDIFDSDLGQDILSTCLKRLPDLERTISRIHAGTCRVKDFIACLTAYTQIFNMANDLKENFSPKSKRLQHLISSGFPTESQDRLEFFHKAFDKDESLETGDICVHPGFDEVFDQAADEFAAVEKELEEYRKKQAAALGVKNLSYKDLGKDLFQLEVPSRVQVPSKWKLMSKTQSVNRYYTKELEALIQRFLEVREGREEALRNVRGRMYRKFDETYSQWLQVVRTVAELDCLQSLARCRGWLDTPICRPKFVSADKNFLQIKNIRHPCVSEPGKDFIPNDVSLGGDDSNMILLTGPNMGGKSTLLRQTCIAVIMAQLGCYVPAESCTLTPFDRIFTRIGANDNIMAGQSTFMVELSETSKILREASRRSLVILDELGRGTSTFDGFAIAFSVLHYLSTRVGCVGLFSTHYGMLTKEFENNKLVALKYMNFATDERNRDVTFLYKLVDGVCPKSFGMNVASMAGVPPQIVDKAECVAAQFEEQLKMVQAGGSATPVRMSRHADFAALWKSSGDPAVVNAILKSLC